MLRAGRHDCEGEPGVRKGPGLSWRSTEPAAALALGLAEAAQQAIGRPFRRVVGDSTADAAQLKRVPHWLLLCFRASSQLIET